MFKFIIKAYKFIILAIFIFFILVILFLPVSIKSLVSNAKITYIELVNKIRVYEYFIKNKDIVEVRKSFEKNKNINIEHYKIDEDIISGSHVLKLKIFDTEFLNVNYDNLPGTNMPYFEVINNNNLLLHYGVGNFAIFNHKNNKLKKINTNYCNILEKHTFNICLEEYKVATDAYEFGVRDIFLDEDLKLYISSYISANEDHSCTGLAIFVSEPLDIKNIIINFKLLYKTPTCVENPNAASSGGRIQRLNTEHIIITIGDFQTSHTDIDKTQENYYKKNHVSQNYNSHFGKTIIIDNEGNSEIYTLGHRNPHGLYKYKNFIIETEHGPNGGDEVNLLIKEKNYGYPYASYGFAYTEDIQMLKTHGNIYEEPILYFSPSIGISEIIVYDKPELHRWKNKTLITSLAENSLFIADIDYEKRHVRSIDKIFLGNINIKNKDGSLNFRIRDIKIDDKGKIWLLTGDNFIGYLEKSKNDYKGF